MGNNGRDTGSRTSLSWWIRTPMEEASFRLWQTTSFKNYPAFIFVKCIHTIYTALPTYHYTQSSPSHIMASTLDVKARFDRIVARLPVQNLSNTDAIEASLAKTDKTPICLWGAYKSRPMQRCNADISLSCSDITNRKA